MEIVRVIGRENDKINGILFINFMLLAVTR
jgi:hypothetical protein